MSFLGLNHSDTNCSTKGEVETPIVKLVLDSITKLRLSDFDLKATVGKDVVDWP